MSDLTPINDNIKEEDVGDATEAPKTPKRKNGAQRGTPKKAKNDTPKPTGKKIGASKIPETFEELAEEDKMLLEWKEVSNRFRSCEFKIDSSKFLAI